MNPFSVHKAIGAILKHVAKPDEPLGEVECHFRKVENGPSVGQVLVQVAADQSRPLCKGQVFLELTKSALK